MYRLIRMPSFGQQLFQGCLCKSMADSRREMLTKRRQSWSMTVTADDIESAADAPKLTGKERRSLPAVSARHHHQQTTHVPASTTVDRGGILALPARCRTLCRCHVSCTNVTPSSPEMEVPPQCQIIRGCQILGVFLTSKEGVDLYAGIYGT